MKLTDREERTSFSVLVLSGIWLVLRVLTAADPRYKGSAMDWRANALHYMDCIGQDTDDARAYRRDITFPELYF